MNSRRFLNRPKYPAPRIAKCEGCGIEITLTAGVEASPPHLCKSCTFYKEHALKKAQPPASG